jgi:hypothetical protein
MEVTANLDLAARRPRKLAANRQLSLSVFTGTLIACACLSALLASWLPLQVSIVTVFLFAGPHNWFELRYFLMRLPVRFGKSRNFFLTAFAGIGFLTIAYVALPVLYAFTLWPDNAWPNVLASWNTLLLLWLGLLVWLRGRQKLKRDWAWAIPVSLGLCSLNWLAPEFFSLAIVYLHPLVALWFLSHALVAVHVFLEMLHYGVWLVALPLIAPLAKSATRPLGPAGRERRRIWDAGTVPLARHPRGFPKLVATALAFGVFLMAILWLGFSVDYATTRDVYFTVAIAHVLAEAPFLLRML